VSDVKLPGWGHLDFSWNWRERMNPHDLWWGFLGLLFTLALVICAIVAWPFRQVTRLVRWLRRR